MRWGPCYRSSWSERVGHSRALLYFGGFQHLNFSVYMSSRGSRRPGHPALGRGHVLGVGTCQTTSWPCCPGSRDREHSWPWRQVPAGWGGHVPGCGPRSASSSDCCRARFACASGCSLPCRGPVSGRGSPGFLPTLGCTLAFLVGPCSRQPWGSSALTPQNPLVPGTWSSTC